MRKTQAMRIGLCLLLATLVFTLPAWTQEVTAAIVGTVADPSGAPIKDATVTAKDTGRGTVWTTKTNDAGVYNLLRVPVGTYELKVSAQGFQTVAYPPFTLVLNQTARIDVQTRVGQVTETVEVTGAAPVLQTQSDEVSTLIDSHTVTSVPLAGRNYLQLTLLAPGSTTNNPRGISEPQTLDNSSRPFINGNREQANQYFLDGQLNSEDKNNETSFTPNVDAIQEFNIITQNASAEFGNYEGGVISVSTKSGTNNSTEAFLNFCEMTRSMQICPRMDGRRAYWRRKIFRARSSRATRLMALSSNRSSATTRSAALLAAPLSRTSCFSLPTTRACAM